jgi:hypothetical protein
MMIVYRRNYRINIVLIGMRSVLNGYFGSCGNSISLHANWFAISGKLFDWLISLAVCVRFYNKHKTKIISAISIGDGASQNNTGCNPRTIARRTRFSRTHSTHATAMLAINQWV